VSRTLRAPLLRATAALAALVLVGTTLLVAWHKAHVEHGVCAEHGEELHLERTGASTAQPVDDASRIRPSTFELEDGDHHCAVAATTRHATTGGAHAPQVVDAGEHAVQLALPAQLAALHVELYRLAPKTSPPV
jgi:uncharacterized protein (DUF2237 family)